MENLSLDSYEPIKRALKELGFTIDFIEKLTRKTVITVSRYEKEEKNSTSANMRMVKGHEVPKR